MRLLLCFAPFISFSHREKERFRIVERVSALEKAFFGKKTDHSPTGRFHDKLGGILTHRIEKVPRPVNSIIQSMESIASFLNVSVDGGRYWTPAGSPYIMEGMRWQNVFGLASDGAASGGNMERFWESLPELTVLWVAVLAVLVAVAWYVIEKIRPKTVQKEPEASQWLSKFRDLHTQGELSDEEFRTIKTTLAAQLQDELKGNGEEG